LHRNLNLGDSQCVFISTRLMDDKFSVAFEFYINVGHALVERVGVSSDFSELAWKQVEAGIRGETSLDAWEARKLATGDAPDAERYQREYFEATFPTRFPFTCYRYISTWIITTCGAGLSLLAPTALAERLRKVRRCFRRTPVLTLRFSTSGALRSFRGVRPSDIRLLAKCEVHHARLIFAHRDRFLPDLRFSEDWTLHLAFGQNVEGFLFASTVQPSCHATIW